VALLPFIGGALMLLAARKRIGWMQAATASGVVALVIAVETFPYFLFNLRHYGILIPMQESLINQAKGVRLIEYFRWFDSSHWGQWQTSIDNWLVTYGLWVGGWSFLLPKDVLVWLYGNAMLLAVLGVPAAWIFRRWSWSEPGVFRDRFTALLALLLCACVIAGMVVHTVVSRVAFDQDSTMSWYMALALPWFMAQVGAGAIAWRRSQLRYGVALFMPGLFVWTELQGAWGEMVRHYSQRKLSVEALRRLASLHPPLLGTATLFIATAAMLFLFGWAVILCLQGLAETEPEAPPT
jgi:hypothetical protein